jgi:RNA-directed DNA polymerase
MTSEAVEGQDLVKGNAGQQNTHRTQCRARVLSELAGVRRVAKRDKEVKFTALFHHITIERLRLAFMEINRKAAAGVDEVTWAQYEGNLEVNLLDLHQRLRRGARIEQGHLAGCTSRRPMDGNGHSA